MKRTGLLDTALALYPAWWRDTYGEEIRTVTQDLVADGRPEWNLAADLVRGALAARVGGRAIPRRRELWAARTRVSVAVATLPWLVVVPFILAAMSGHAWRPISDATISYSATRASSYAYDAMMLTLTSSFCAAVIGWSALAGGVRRSRRPGRRRLIGLAYVPLVAFLADLGLFIARVTQIPNSFVGHGNGAPVALDGDPAAAHALLVALWVVFVVGVGASVWSLAVVTKDADLPLWYLRSGKRIATFMAISVTLMAVSAVVGGIAAELHGHIIPALWTLPDRGQVVSGQTREIVAGWWLAAVPLTVAAVVSLAGWHCARRAWRTTVLLTPIAETRA